MKSSAPRTKRCPFPRRMPPIAICPSRAKPFAVACRELLWWFVVPRVGDHTLWATYDAPDWKLTGYTDLRVTRPAVIHGVEGVEVQVEDFGETASQIATFYGRLTAKKAQYLAVALIEDGRLVLRTFLDEGFDEDWGEYPRRFEDRGRFVLQEDGSFRQTTEDPEVLGAGVFRVYVGRRPFTCLRVLYLDGPLSDAHTTLIEAYLTRTGRTVLQRHCCQGSRGKGHASAARPPTVIDGVRFLPWYDCLGHLACAIR